MKNFKKIMFISALTLTSVTTLSAQKEILEDSEKLFDDATGSFTRVFTEKEDLKTKIVTINPAIDDVIWRRVVLRAIDLREQQNRPLFFPHENLEPESQKNLFSIILANFLDGNIKGYNHPDKFTDPTKVPRFADEYITTNKDFYNMIFRADENQSSDENNEEYGMEYDNEFSGDNNSSNDEFVGGEEISFDNLPADKALRTKTFYDIVNDLTPGVIKYYIQEVWYFNKTSSTFENKIIAIAPVLDRKYLNTLIQERYPDVDKLLFWIPYETLRPYLHSEFMKISGRNLSPLTNFDEFFMSRQFYGYIIKGFTPENRPIDYGDIENNPDAIRKEQQLVEDEIMNFEQDLWNY